METIKIVYHDDIKELEALPNGDWIDLRAAEDVELSMLEDSIISLGVSMKLPEGYEAHIVPRSSTFKKWGILQVNGTGIIDNSYSGTNDVWRFHALCMRTRTKIHKGDRICQFRIFPKQCKLIFDKCTELDAVNRGGFGSTGTN